MSVIRRATHLSAIVIAVTGVLCGAAAVLAVAAALDAGDGQGSSTYVESRQADSGPQAESPDDALQQSLQGLDGAYFVDVHVARPPTSEHSVFGCTPL